MTSDPPEPLALYIHWPFCLAKCPYCDFNSHVTGDVDQGLWREALRMEMGYFAARTGPRLVTSVFFGGGTPSLMTPETVAGLLEDVAAAWHLDPGAEISLEANPGAVDWERFEGFAAAGVNRLSLGVQALDDEALTFLGRIHDCAEALAALETAQKLFPRVSMDMIYARPGQTAKDWRAELRRALSLGTGHISLYQLTIERGTAFFGRGITPPDEDLAVALFDLTQEETERAGLPAYEISNHARIGEECRHNLAGWRGADYVGLGPGAHGRLGNYAIRQRQSPEGWLQDVRVQGHGMAENIRLSPEDRAVEKVMTGLRLKSGILTTPAIEAVLNPPARDQLMEDGLLINEQGRLCTTNRGRLLLDSVLNQLIAQ